VRRRWIGWGLAVLALLAGLVFGFYAALDWRFDSDAPEARFPEPSTLAEARLQDVEQLELFLELERSWTPETLRRAREDHQELRRTASKMSDAEFDLAVARLVARADNAHSKVREYDRTPRYSRLPVRGHPFADGYHIIRAHAGHERLLGARVLAIGEIGMDEVKQRLRPYIAGPEGTFLKYLPYLLEVPELMHAAGLIARPDRMPMDLEVLSGEREQVVFEAPFPPSDEQIARSYQLLSPVVYSESQPDWQTLPAPGESPLYLQAALERFQRARLSDPEATYIQFWSNSDGPEQSIGDFCEESLRAFRADPTPVLIVDHRFNSGGNYLKTRDCMSAFGASIPPGGRLYIIVGGATFSAGLYSVGFLAQAAGDQAMLVGEPVGDRLRAWGEDNLLRLPNSGIEIKFSTGLHDLTRPCRDLTRCFWLNILVDLRIDSLAPDIPALQSFADYARGVDPALEAIRRHERLPARTESASHGAAD